MDISRIDQLIERQALLQPASVALEAPDGSVRYGDLHQAVDHLAGQFVDLGVTRGERVAVIVTKRLPSVVALFALSRIGAVLVPVNPVLTPSQIAHIIDDSGAVLLVAVEAVSQHLTCSRFGSPAEVQLEIKTTSAVAGLSVVSTRGQWQSQRLRAINGLAAILYTSGSTGRPKGVMVSQTNLLDGSLSVCQYLEISTVDRILVLLPLSFDYGLNQLITAFDVGACAVLYDYLLARDVPRVIERSRITGIAAVPHVFSQLACVRWPTAARRMLRYLTNSGGTMPVATTRELQSLLPDTAIHLMYGLTEAFRSTSLAPDQLGLRPHSIGKAIPRARVLVLNEQGKQCEAFEEGELVHAGNLVSMGYWANPEATAHRFRNLLNASGAAERAVWTGDRGYADEQGYLYHVGRNDDLIKSRGYRVSPSEVEDALYSSGWVACAVVFGVADPAIGQRIIALVTVREPGIHSDVLLAYCHRKLPNYLVPAHVSIVESLPINQNGKIDRLAAGQRYMESQP